MIRVGSGLWSCVTGSSAVFGGAVSTAGTHRAHGEGSPGASSRREGATKLRHG